MRILLTGFEPFGGETVNPSAEIVKHLTDAAPPGIEVRAAVLPVAFGPDVDAAWPLWDAFRPDVVLILGQNMGAAELLLERYAHNLKQDRGPGGALGPEAPIIAEGPAAYESTLPVSALAERLRERGVPARVSRDAGTYVCNHLLYRALHRAFEAGDATRVGFVHLPLLPEQAVNRPGRPCLPPDLMARGIRLILEQLRGE